MQLTHTAPYVAPATVATATQPAPANPQGSVPVNADAATAAREGQKSDPQGQQERRDSRIEVSSGAQGEETPKASSQDPDAKLVEQQLDTLKARDQEVRTHEQAHARAGGKHAGSPEYEFVRGSDGRMYAQNGEVSIDTSKVDGDPQATIDKMETVIRAANAPMQPSNQDRRVAAQASIIMNQATLELAELEQQADPDSQESNTTEATRSAAVSGAIQSNDNAETAPAEAASLSDTSDSQQTNRDAQNRLEQNMLKSGAFQQAFPPGTVIDDRL
ncbi:putative metalloprotease CJM1_0395 family protein [Ferrimonas futtsuensis]|uniref:putative metalloprotease CJM1_0395 family protein n=1 Tax=Ferrimonas futtsuensis TaxID=364764 RepID=UPI0003F8CE0E|nr:putative metalloprotease CJM1_0395 family protein [Ferrimonas futtsuensis]